MKVEELGPESLSLWGQNIYVSCWEFEKQSENILHKREGVLTISIKPLADSQKLEYLIQLTDNSNPQFFFCKRFSEVDFQTLKQDQQVLVEFQNFPEKIQELFDLCSVKDVWIS